MPPAWHKAPSAPPQARKPGCTGKMAYESRGEARRVAERVGHRFYYPCGWCGLWHTSTQGLVKPPRDAS